MSTTREEVLGTAMELSESDRLLLATELMNTVSDDLSCWSIADSGRIDELDSRVQDGSPAVAWESVKARLQADLES